MPPLTTPGAMPDLYWLPFVPSWSRHDEPDDDTADGDDGDTADDSDADGDTDDGGGTGTGDAEKTPPTKKATPKTAPKPAGDLMGDVDPKDPRWKSIQAERVKRQQATRDAETARKELAAAQARIQEFEDSQRTELERAQAAATAAAAREKTANERAVRSELRTAALEANALDPTDVMEHLERRMGEFITDTGVDTDAIEKAVADVLAKKPHWLRPTKPDDDDPDAAPVKPKKRAPAPDPGQGSKGGQSTPNWNDPETLAAEKRRLGLPAYG